MDSTGRTALKFLKAYGRTMTLDRTHTHRIPQPPPFAVHVPFGGMDRQDSVVGEGRDMDAGEVKALSQGVAAIEMGL